MKEIIEAIINFLTELVQSSSPIVGIVIGMTIIILESIIPILPLALFIAINMLVFGNLMGFLISWVATIIGCILAFTIFRELFRTYIHKKISKKTNILKLIDSISNIKFTTLVIIMAMPFSPAFAINIAAGLSKISYRKFLVSVILSKASLVYFWGFVGTTLIESITDIKVIIEISMILLIAYILSKIVNKKFNIE
jgi:uncharacterized membrane protein YdjX (TVP38/TMEM64 family)